MTSKATKAKFELDVPEQGIERQIFKAEDAVEWLQKEKAEWQALQLPDDFQILNQRYQSNLRQGYERYLQRVVDSLSQENAQEKWSAMIADARAGRILFLQGRFGERIKKLKKQDKANRGVILAAALSEAAAGGDQQVMPMLRAMIIDHVWSAGIQDVYAADVLRKQSAAAAGEIEKAIKRLDDFIAGTTERLTTLEAVYHEKLLMEGPSRHWRGVAESAAAAKRTAFVAFCILLAVPACILALWWNDVTSYIDHLISQSSGSISLTAIAVITVPALAYGWLLKHVSRSYVQNLAIETDARHRRVMTTTFLGLAKRKAVDLNEADRALILNALFRPAPPHMGDDGPPAGLVDFLRGKT